jgi:HlyD family secretion protein
VLKRRCADCRARASSRRARLEAARARQQRAESQIRAQQGSVRAAQLQVEYTRLVALNPGTITERITEPGTLLEPGTPVFKLQNTQQVRVQAKVAEQDAQRLRVGYPVWIRRYAEPNRLYTARLSAIFREADPATRTMIVEAILPNGDGRIAVGEYTEMRIGLLPPRHACTHHPDTRPAI